LLAVDQPELPIFRNGRQHRCQRLPAMKTVCVTHG
jgi:hypothetical protein